MGAPAVREEVLEALLVAGFRILSSAWRVLYAAQRAGWRRRALTPASDMAPVLSFIPAMLTIAVIPFGIGMEPGIARAGLAQILDVEVDDVPWRCSRGICPPPLGELARKFSRATPIDPS